MAEAAVGLLIQNLKQLLVNHGHLFSGADHEAEKLDNHLHRFKALLKDVPEQSRNNGHHLTELITRIRNAVHYAEVAIDAYVSQNNLSQEPPNIAGIVEEVEAAIGDMGFISDENRSAADFADAEVEDGGTDDNEALVRPSDFNPTHQTRIHDGVVGIEDEEATMVRYLVEETTRLEVISIIGMPGLGKTILANKVFHNSEIRFKFPTGIWVYISQVFTEKEILLNILKELTLLTDDIMVKTEKELADFVAGFLENESFLLVMDDLWSPGDWDRLKVALPMSNRRGRVLITSRIAEVGRHVNSRRDYHNMRFLTADESFKLLQLEVFGSKNYHVNLECYLRQIAKKCRGHPLAIVLTGGILVKQYSRDMIKMQTAWQNVSQSLNNDLSYDEEQHLGNIIAMSYEKMPYHLRECFLYFGMFPEDFEIPVWKLTRLWIAEGFIPLKVDVSSEETAENYFQELIERKLVRGVTFKIHGEVKTCRVHDMILDFCIEEGKRERLFQEIGVDSGGGFQPSISRELMFRRICIHSHALDFVSKKPNGPTVRTFICTSREELTMPMEDLLAIPKGFNLLRVLDVEPFNFKLKLPRNLSQLLHLKYLFLCVEIHVLPLSFSQLLNIQTLVFNTRTRTLEIRADILSLTQLRHFETKASAVLPETSTSSPTVTAGENFQTLGTISPESCTKDVFDRVRNLKKLGVRGNLGLLLDGEKESFSSLGKLENLEKLKLLHDVFPIPPSGFPILSLPPPSIFPPKLKILTLSRTYLDWCHIRTIERLNNLEVLKLEEKAFVGDTWEVSDGGFLCLEVLRIERTNLKIWVASDNQFPKLKHLQLQLCDDLERIPVALADVQSFVKLELLHCKRATASAREIAAKRQQDNVAREIHLSISPFQER